MTHGDDVRPGPIRNVVIAGGGTAGWMAAAAFATRVMPSLNCTVTLIESEEIGTVGVGEGTLVSFRQFNRHTYGVGEAELMRQVQGTFKLGIRFENWARPGDCYFHPFGRPGQAVREELIDFHHLWLHGRRLGDTAPIAEYSLGAMAAAAGKVMGSARFDSPLLSASHSLHLDAGLYAAFLRRHAEQRGVRRIEGRIADVTLRRGDGFIESVTLADGHRVAGDLFIDCTGFRSVLLGQALGVGFEDWTHLLPCDRAVAVPAEEAGTRPPFTRAIARRHGWQWYIPLQHRSGNGYVYSSRHCSDDEATALLLANLPGRPLAEPRTLRFTSGRRRTCWERNCVALGLAAGFVEPLEATAIMMIHDAILRLLNLFPDNGFDSTIIDLFNRLTQEKLEHVRDFLVLHYYANERAGDPFWKAVATMPIPESLERRIERFRRTAHAEVNDSYATSGEHGVFPLTSWVAVMLGQNIVPHAYHPLVAARGADVRLLAVLATMRNRIRKAVPELPEHDLHLAQYCPAEPAPVR